MVHLGNLMVKMWDSAGIMQFPVLGTELQLLALGDPVKILVAHLEDLVQALLAPLVQKDLIQMKLQGHRMVLLVNQTEDRTEDQMED